MRMMIGNTCNPEEHFQDSVNLRVRDAAAQRT